MDELRKIILNLINEKREDAYWDFKREWHLNNAELLHDIICLANADYHGNRYLILGITDPPDCKIVDIHGDPNRKNQAKLLDFLSKAPFSGDIRPYVSIKTIPFAEGEVDIVIIHDEKQKPYTLTELFEQTSKYQSGTDKKVILHPGAVYTRIGDKNTAIDRTADLYFVERMWRERFRLDLSPLDRIQKYLIDYDNWKWDGVNTGYYSTFPEFTVMVGDGEVVASSNHWWNSWPCNEQTRRFSYLLKFHTTVLTIMKVIRFDREDFAIPFPDVDYILIDPNRPREAESTYCFYSYLETTLGFSLLVHLFAPHLKNGPPIQRMREKEALGSPTKPRLGFLPFPVFSSEGEKSSFVRHLEQKISDFLKSNPTYPSTQLGGPKQTEEKTFSYWAYDEFWKCKQK